MNVLSPIFQTVSLPAIVVGIIAALSVSLLGVFVVGRKMALVSDALSHVALPGIALALILNIDPFFGALATLIVAVFGVSFIERQGILSFETLVGIFFTAALAVGLLIIPDEHLLESLFGDIANIGYPDAIKGIIAGLIIFSATIIFFKKFAKITFSPDLTWGEGTDVNRFNLIFLLLLSLAVGLGIKIIGALLTGALIILPASAAKNSAGSLRSLTIAAIFFGIISVVVGLLIAGAFHLPPGPMVVMIAAIIFILSFFVKKT